MPWAKVRRNILMDSKNCCFNRVFTPIIKYNYNIIVSHQSLRPHLDAVNSKVDGGVDCDQKMRDRRCDHHPGAELSLGCS